MSERTFDQLNDGEKKEVVRLFREAALCRAHQWDAERCIETLLGREINVPIEEYATMVGTDDQDFQIGEDDVRQALEA